MKKKKRNKIAIKLIIFAMFLLYIKYTHSKYIFAVLFKIKCRKMKCRGGEKKKNKHTHT